MWLAVANEYNLVFVYLKRDIQHNDIFGTSSFLISHDEIIANITAKEISITRLSKETQHLHRQAVMGLGFPNGDFSSSEDFIHSGRCVATSEE